MKTVNSHQSCSNCYQVKKSANMPKLPQRKLPSAIRPKTFLLFRLQTNFYPLNIFINCGVKDLRLKQLSTKQCLWILLWILYALSWIVWIVDEVPFIEIFIIVLTLILVLPCIILGFFVINRFIFG